MSAPDTNPIDNNVGPAPANVTVAPDAALQDQITALQAQVDGLPARVANEVVQLLLAGKNLAGFPDDMGLPHEFQLGQPTQNYFVWSANMGATRALQSPETLLLMAAMLDAMATAPPDPASRVAAAQVALLNVKRALHG